MVDNGNCKYVINRLLDFKELVGSPVPISEDLIPEMFPDISQAQLIHVLKYLDEKNFAKVENIETNYITVHVTPSILVYNEEKATENKKIRNDRKWELFKITFQTILGFLAGVFSTLLVQFFLKNPGTH